MAARLTPRRLLRLTGAVLLVLAVVTVHGCVAGQWADHLAALDQSAAMPPRMQATYVRSMELVAPTPMAAAAAPPPPRRAPRVARAEPAAQAASMPEPEPEPAPPKEPASDPGVGVADVDADADADADVPPAEVDEAQATAMAEPEASVGAGDAADLPVFEWPMATRVSFNLTGNYQGEIFGSAQVEWLRDADRYQVHLDVRVPPLMSRRMSSEGLITGEGLAPERYDQETKVAFSQPSRATVHIRPDGVRLANGTWRERWPGLQDTASQFVQLAWLLSTRPELLRPGGTVDMPLALPRNVDRTVYDVADPETLHTPFGEIPAVHLKPRRVARAGTDMTLEMWLAPQFRYLPIRVIIRQDANTFIDLAITRPPELAAP